MHLSHQSVHLIINASVTMVNEIIVNLHIIKGMTIWRGGGLNSGPSGEFGFSVGMCFVPTNANLQGRHSHFWYGARGPWNWEFYRHFGVNWEKSTYCRKCLFH